MANIQTPDALLVQNYVAGDENALATLIKGMNPDFGLFTLKFLIETYQMIFSRYFYKSNQNKIKFYNEEGKFLPWVMSSHNLIIDHFRKTKKCPV
jgi:RNA polymerase sigma-70 factor (ECF subfamily)